jgi:stage II sporulation protein AA (anti-sigma F factor antagonist)
VDDVKLERRGDLAIVRVRGDIDLANRDSLLDLMVAAARDGVRRVVLDLVRVEYIDSAGVRLVFEASRSLEGLGTDLALVRPERPYVARILALAAVEHAVAVFDDEAAAVAGE